MDIKKENVCLNALENGAKMRESGENPEHCQMLYVLESARHDESRSLGGIPEKAVRRRRNIGTDDWSIRISRLRKKSGESKTFILWIARIFPNCTSQKTYGALSFYSHRQADCKCQGKSMPAADSVSVAAFFVHFYSMKQRNQLSNHMYKMHEFEEKHKDGKRAVRIYQERRLSFLLL